jgi:hypothetical protein
MIGGDLHLKSCSYKFVLDVHALYTYTMLPDKEARRIPIYRPLIKDNGIKTYCYSLTRTDAMEIGDGDKIALVLASKRISQRDFRHGEGNKNNGRREGILLESGRTSETYEQT